MLQNLPLLRLLLYSFGVGVGLPIQEIIPDCCLLPGLCPFLLFPLQEEYITLCHRDLLIVPSLSPNGHLC